MEKGLDVRGILREAYEQIDKIAMMSEASLCEWQWEWEFQKEVDGVVFQSLIKTLRDEWQWEQDFQKEVDGIVFQSLIKTRHDEWQREQEFQKEVDGIVFQSIINTPRENFQEKVIDFSSLREDLNDISKSLFSPELPKLSSHGSFEGVEESPNERKDGIHGKVLGSHLSPSSCLQDKNRTALENSKDSENTMSEVMECPQLKHMTKEEIINYFKTKMTDMKREHEMKVREMTEKYYSLKREFIKEQISSNLRKDNDIEALMKKIPEAILKLDDILVENEKSPASCDDYENICCLKDRVNSLLSENCCLKDMLIAEKREAKSLSLNLSDAAAKLLHHSMAEANFLKQIKKLECDMGDVNIESFLTEDIYKCVLREFTGEIKCDVEDSLLSENQHLQDMLIYKTKEVESLSLQLSDAATELSHHSMAEANFLKQIKKLECDMEDVNIESFLTEDIYKCVLREFTGEIKCDVEDSILSENQNLQDMLIYKTKEVESLSLQLSDAATKLLHHSMAEANFLKQIKKLECDMEDVNIESFLTEDIYKCVLREFTGEIKCNVEDSILSENQNLQDMLIYKTKEVESLSIQLSDATTKLSHHSMAEANFLKQIKKLECDMEDVNIESFLTEDIYKCVLGEFTGEIKCDVEDSILSENQNLQDMLIYKTKWVESLSLQLSDAANKLSHHSMAEANFLKQIKKLECDMEDVNIESFLTKDIYKCVLGEFTGEIKCDVEDSILSENQNLQDMLIYKTKDVESLSLLLSDTATKLSHHSMAEANFLKQIKKLECDMEDVNIESFLTKDIYKCVLREFTGQIKCDVEDRILSENQNLQDMLIYITKVVGTLFLQLFDAATKLSHHSMAEANFLKQLKKLECDMEDVNIESFLTEDIHKCVLREFTGEIKCDVEDSILSENQNLQDMLIYKTKEVESLSLQLSDAAAKLSHHSMVEANFLKHIKKLECDMEDVNIESFLTEDIYKCVLREFTGQIKCNVEDSILSENQNLQDMLIYKTKEVESLSLQLSDTATKLSHHSMAEANFLKQIKKLECDTEDANIESFIREDIYKCVLRDLTSQIKCAVEDSDIQDILVNLLTTNYNEEKERGDHLEEKLLKNEDAFQKEKAFLSALLEEKEKSMSEMGSRLTEQRKHLELVRQELNRETNLINSRSDEAFERIGLHEVDVTKLYQKLKVAANDLMEATRERNGLHGIIQEMQNIIRANEGEQRKKMESSFASIQGLAKSMADFECRVTEKIMQICSRLDILDLKCKLFAQKANLLKRKGLGYKQKLE